MRIPLFSAAALQPLVLAACATPSGEGRSGPIAATRQMAQPQSAYGAFLAGESAMNAGKNGEASKFFDQARAVSGGDTMIAERAFMSALMAGDVTRAVSLIPPDADASEQSK